MSCWSLSAIRMLPECKTRLAECLSSQRRIELAAAMLSHVVSVLGRTTGVDRVAVVSPNPVTLPAHVIALDDPGGGLNQAVTAAALKAVQHGADRLLIAHADLPLLQPEEVMVLIEASKTSGLAIAPDHRGRGTNALCLSVPPTIRFQFGPESFERHLAQAAVRGISPAVVRLPGLAFDLDVPADLLSWSNYSEQGIMR